MVASGTIKWVTAGGDHSTDFYGDYGDITLSYGRKTGIGSYGPKFTQPGARVLDLTYDESTGNVDIRTWIRQRDGTVDSQEEEKRPAAFSWLKTDHCYGAESVTSIYDANNNKYQSFWLPEFIS